ncbi:hypothetical protein L1987_78931 [Smallanthus sonchifolius]|uniref:Uncharacterized protein n=1 Tax=Smallanthus sonchifolius TaxID=185202 RepID=A0ACB8ZEM4_9ASTR|nr:hypothetical protein L1987_78931 [Smallanthus sonchifolius]
MTSSFVDDSQISQHYMSVNHEDSLAINLLYNFEKERVFNRLHGSSRQGLAFAGAINHNFGRFDAKDQVAGAEWLVKEGFAKSGDSEGLRVGCKKYIF